MDFHNITLSWEDFSWEGTVDGPVLREIRSAMVELRVNTEDEQQIPPHDLQVEAWNSLVADTSSYSTLILSGFYNYYLEVRPRYVAAGDDWAKQMPEISSASDIGPMLRLNSVNIGWPYDGTVTLGFASDCQWDREHGAGIVFKQGAQVDIGGVDCLH